MEPNCKICWKMIRVTVFSLGIGLDLIGVFLMLDAFVPKERRISFGAPVVEFAGGVFLIAIGVWLVRRNRLFHS
jgi:cytochrome c biogenesis protein CcdA